MKLEYTDELCGESYDHDLKLISEGDDGSKSWECRRCGAEVIEDPEDEL